MAERNKWRKIIGALFVSILFFALTLGRATNFPSGLAHLTKELQEKAADQSLQQAPDDTQKVRVIKMDAVLRLKPKDDAVVLRKLPLGALLDVEEQLDDWLKISLPPDKDKFVVTGYLHKSFTEPSSVIHR